MAATNGRITPATLFPERLELELTEGDARWWHAGRWLAQTHPVCRAAKRVGYDWAWHHGTTVEVGFNGGAHDLQTFWCAHYALPLGPVAAGPLLLERARVEDWSSHLEEPARVRSERRLAAWLAAGRR